MRLAKLDTIRGINLISMIAYHAVWDMVYLFGAGIPWYTGAPGYVWQQLICQTFILLSGFSWNLGHHHLKRGLIVFFSGALVSLVTYYFMPEALVLFGILTFMGSAMLIMIPVDALFSRIACGLQSAGGAAGESGNAAVFHGKKRVSAAVLLCLSVLLFTVTRHAGSGFLGFTGFGLFPHVDRSVYITLPAGFYRNYLTAYLGFPFHGFFSDDYFPLIPWFFLYLTGYSLYHLLPLDSLRPVLSGSICPPLEFIGRHTLIIYLLHQPVVFGLLSVVFR